MNSKLILNYSLVLHHIREALALSLMDYCVADSIYHLSSNPSSPVPGWCNASKKTIAEFLRTTDRTVFESINRLIKKDLVERHPETKFLRTTDSWYRAVILPRAKADHKDLLASQGMKKLHSQPRSIFTPNYEETSHNNNKNKEKDKNVAANAASGKSDSWDAGALREYLDKMDRDPNIGVKLIASFLLTKGVGVERGKVLVRSEAEMREIIKRNIRTATSLAKTYPFPNILSTMEVIDANARDFVWTLETVQKMISYSREELIKALTKNKKY